ncbi:MAG TPA: hypothetical protein PKA06_14750, partial [Gemmatales bacterium]|nr:hypothetical protein [Gemmatales bacterium]
SEGEEDSRPIPMRLPAATVEAIDEVSTPKPAPNIDLLKSRLLQQRKPPPNTHTNKPGPGTRPPQK